MTIETSLPISPFTLTRLDIHVFRASVSKPVVTSFKTMNSRATALLRVEDTDGAHGWGEIWGNFPTITSEHRARLAAWALPSLAIGAEVSDPAAFHAHVRAKLQVIEVQSDEPGPIAGIAAALDQAIWDLAARKHDVSLRRLLRGNAPDSVPAYASGLNPKGAANQVAAARMRGFQRFKLKIGFGDNVDLPNLDAIRAGMTDDETLFVDANMRWSPEEAATQVGKLSDYGLGWIEEPIRADEPAEAWRALRTTTTTPLAGGENLRGDQAFTESMEWLNFMQPDVGKLGGISGCYAIARQALDAGVTYCPHWLSGGVGLLHSANLLAGVGGDGVLEMDVNENPLREAVSGGAIELRDGDAHMPTGPGIGLDVDAAVRDLESRRVLHETITEARD
jgi:D-galactarolactone cycloisomerase